MQLRMIFLVILLIGCSKEKSENLTAKDIYTAIDIVQNADGSSEVTVEMRKDSILGMGVELSQGDSLVAIYEGKETILQKDEDLIHVDYVGKFYSQGSTGELIVRFKRDKSASIDTKIHLLPAFTLHYPTHGNEFRNDESIPVQWSPGVIDGTMRIHGYLACRTIDDELDVDLETENEEWGFSDTGNYSFTADVLIKSLERELVFEDDEHIIKSEKCDMDLDLFRSESKFIGDVYAESSSIKVKQIRSIKGIKVSFN
jgi:hypothetical protein